MLEGEFITLLIRLKTSFSFIYPFFSSRFSFHFLAYFHFTRHLKFLVTLTCIKVISVTSILAHSSLTGTQNLTTENVSSFCSLQRLLGK